MSHRPRVVLSRQESTHLLFISHITYNFGSSKNDNALIDTYNLRDNTGVACTELPGPSPVSIERGLKPSFARTTFLTCELDFYQRIRSTNQSRDPSVSHSDEFFDDTNSFHAPQRRHS